jgi:hypothetical protein
MPSAISAVTSVFRTGVEALGDALTPLTALHRGIRRRNALAEFSHSRQTGLQGFAAVTDRVFGGLAIGHAVVNVGIFDQIPATVLIRKFPNDEGIGVHLLHFFSLPLARGLRSYMLQCGRG